MSASIAKIAELLRRMGWPVRDHDLYLEALTHSSYAYETGIKSNERLEFLGDAVLELVISEYFFKTFPHYPEGKLTMLRHYAVNEATLAHLAQEMEIGHYLRLGKGEAASGGAGKPSLLADALESLVGALFIDLGYQKAREIIIELFKPVLNSISEGRYPSLDFKTMLQEICQSEQGKTPAYRIISESGPAHAKTFEAAVVLDDKQIGKGRGKSKKEAEQSAAKFALEFMDEMNNNLRD